MPDEVKTFDDFKKRYHLATPPQILGEGGFGKVFLAYDELRSRDVAIKVSEVKGDGNAYSLLKEAQLVKEQIPEHTNIAFYQACYRLPLGLTESDYAVMDYYPLGNLKQFCQKQTLTPEQKQDIALQILSGLQHLHHTANNGRGIIHRDLKSSNILITYNPVTVKYIPKIGDFGISKSLSSGSGHTSNSFAGGSLYYAAPEQLSGLESIAKNADLWSWGILTYELYTGELPFTLADKGNEESRQGRFYDLLKQEPAPPLLHTIPQPMQEAIRRCLLFDKTKRLQTVAEALAVLNVFVELPTIITEPPGPIIEEIVTILPNQSKNNEYSFEVKGVKFEWIRVEGGEFMMGSPKDNSLWNWFSGESYTNEMPQHRVVLSDFWIGKFPLTQLQYKTIMGNNPSYFKGDDLLPVENVSWQDTVKFCQLLGELSGKQYRLPTEAQWEYAARGGNKSKGYIYAGSNKIAEVAWYEANSQGKTQPVGLKIPNELGIHDMSGNVWEWCHDWYDSSYYKNSPKQNPKGPSSGSYRVLRGGSWYDSAVYCRVAVRNDGTPTGRSNSCGFRIVLLP